MATKPVARSAQQLSDRKVESIALKNLLLDPKNPRFGGHVDPNDQPHVLERIVTQFGIDDVLASLAVNGYFPSEPIVARRSHGKYVVVEGNRRLAACLILANDQRARAFLSRRPSRVNGTWSPDTEIPVLVFDANEQKQLLPYLGVRHIVGSQAWDSFAKARWINDVLDGGLMTLEEIADAVGDSNRTIFRMLDGYRFVTQLIESKRFQPDQSHRRGRGSNPEFPFSWVYTLLDYSPVREYLELPPRNAPKAKPIPAKCEAAASKAVVYLFGDASRPPSIRDSRQIGDLADALVDPNRRLLLEEGRTIDEIIRLSRSAPDQLADVVRSAQDALRSAVGILGAAMLTAKEAEPFVKPAHEVRQLARDVYERINKIAYPDEDANA